jgi:hypothetical protein
MELGQYEDGVYLDLLPGTVFGISIQPHDSWVVGEEPYVSLHILNLAKMAVSAARAAESSAQKSQED